MSQRPATLTTPRNGSALGTAAAFFCNLIWEKASAIGRAKIFPQDSPVAIAPNSFLDSSLSFVGEELRSDVRGGSLDLGEVINSGHARRARLRRRCCSLYVPGSNRGKTRDGRRVVRKVQWLADRSRNRSRVFPVPEPNGSRNLHHLGRSSLPYGKACNA
jgi:hypothetical protein